MIEESTGITFNPSALWHGFSGYGGGLLTFGMKLYNLGDNIFCGGEHEAKDLPFVGKFYVNSGDDKSKKRIISDEYRDIEGEFKAFDKEYRRNFRDRNMSEEELQQRLKEMDADGEIEVWDSIVGDVNAVDHLNKSIKQLEETDPEMADTLRREAFEFKKSAVEKIRQIKKRRKQK